MSCNLESFKTCQVAARQHIKVFKGKCQNNHDGVTTAHAPLIVDERGGDERTISILPELQVKVGQRAFKLFKL